MKKMFNLKCEVQNNKFFKKKKQKWFCSVLVVLYFCLISGVNSIQYNKSHKLRNLDKLTKEIQEMESIPPSGKQCSEFEFTCKSDQKCIPLVWKCDLTEDCSDGSDERLSDCILSRAAFQVKCDSDEFFHCKYSKKCIPKSWLCDEVFDCGLIGKFNLLDTSDEGSPNCTHKCSKNKLSCSNSVCLPIAKFCDGNYDCQDDETHCSNRTLCQTLKCDHDCKMTPHGPRCFCPVGQEIEDGTKCVPYDQCKAENLEEGDICDQECINLETSYKCGCSQGYERFEDQCYGINNPPSEPKALFVLTSNEMYRIILPKHRNNTAEDLSSPVTLTEVLKLKNPISMELDFNNHSVCVLENSEIICYNTSNFLQKWKLPSPDLFPNLESISQMLLDWYSNNWYFMDTINNLIFVCSYTMTNCRIIVESMPNETSKYRFFAIDPNAGFLFMTKHDSANKTTAGFLRYSMDGTEEKSLISEKLFYPNDLTLDLAMQRIYFLDHYFDFIQQCDYDGGNRKFLQKLPLMKFHRIAFFENSFYGAVARTLSVVQINKSSSTDKKVLAENLKANTKMLKIFHMLQQPPLKKSLQDTVVTSTCEHLTIPYINQTSNPPKLIQRCLCKEGFTLNGNGKCEQSKTKSFIMFVRENPRMLKAVSVDQEEVFTPITNLQKDISFDVNINDRIVYFSSSSESKKNKIEYQSFDGTNRSILLDNMDVVRSLAYDWLGKNLYFITNAGILPAKIGAIKLNGVEKKPRMVKSLITKDLLNPVSLALDIENGVMYWSSWADNFNSGGKIEMSWMDGTNRKGLTSMVNSSSHTIYWPSSLVYYKADRKLYWFDVLTQSIESLSLTGDKARKKNPLKSFFVSSVTVLNDRLYWSDSLIGHIDVVNITAMDYKKEATKFFVTHGKISMLKAADFSTYLTHVETEKQKACPGLWLPTPQKTAVCMCGDGTSQNAMGTDCIPSVTPSISKKEQIICPQSNFHCASGDECIDNNYLCDGKADCTDGSDEVQAPDGPCQKNCDFKCDDNSRCLLRSHVCDRIVDCVDETDESSANCPNSNSECDENGGNCPGFDDYCDEFICQNSRCVEYDVVCDGDNNCGDNSDEQNCNSTIPISGEEDDNRFHILSDVDDDDESYLETTTEDESISDADCTVPNYYCAQSKKCIPVHKLCDGRRDCSDGSDESGLCSEKLCDHITDCQFFCHNAPHTNGYVCSCPQHMFLEADGKTCSAPQVCDNFSTCSHLCLQLNPTKVKCKCFHGYKLNSDNFTCESLHPETPIILFSNRHVIRGMNMKTLQVQNYFSLSKNLIALDFFYDRNEKTFEIIWSDVYDDKIYSGDLKGEELLNVKPIVESGLSTTEAVAIDWIGQNLYWIDSNLRQIEVARKSGMFRKTLISENMSNPRSIALDPRMGFLFWSDWENDNPRIERSTLSGDDRKTIIVIKSIQGAWPNGLTLDYVKKRIFFLDAKSKEIHTINYDGGEHKKILKNQEYLSHPFAISAYDNFIFWTDWRLNSVMRADKFTGNNVTVLYRATAQPFDVKIMHPSRQPWDFNAEGLSKEVVNPCSRSLNNGGCSHLCLLSTNNTFKCDCPHLMRLLKDGKNCGRIDDILLFISGGAEIRGVDLLKPYSNAISTISHSTQIMTPTHLDFYPQENRLYWTDVQLKEVKSVQLSTQIMPSNQKIETILDASIENVHGFAIDWISNLIFFTQLIPSEDETEVNDTKTLGSHRLMATNLKGEYLSKVMDNLNQIYSLIAYPEMRKLYFVMLQNSTDEGYAIKVTECNMDGTEPKVIVTEDEVIQSLALDTDLNRLYFIKNYRKIFYYDLKANKLSSLVNTFYGHDDRYVNTYINCLEIYKDFIYYAENSTNSIQKCNKESCSSPEIFRNNTANIKQLKIFPFTNKHYGTATNGCREQRKKGKKCQHLCIPKDKMDFVCQCAVGYHQDPADSFKCIGFDDFIVYSMGYELKGMSLIINDTHNELITPLQRIHEITSLDFDTNNDYFYLSDNENGEILRIKKDGSAREVLLNSNDNYEHNNGADWLGGLAVDWIAENLYWTDQKRGLIEVSRLNGQHRYVVTSQLLKPFLIAVDPLLGVMFFVDGEYKIIRQNLDGSIKFYVTKNVGNIVNHFILDVRNQQIFWCESKRNKIWQIDYDGAGRKELAIESVYNPISLDILDGRLYWAERGNGTIRNVDLQALNDTQTMKSNLSNQLKGLKIFSTRKQIGGNLCSMPHYGGCEELCLFNGNNGSCFCSHGQLDPNNGKKCLNFQNFLYYSRIEAIEKVHVSSNENTTTNFNITGKNYLKNVIALTYDYNSNLIFYSDLHLNAIYSCDFYGKNFRKLIDDQFTVEGITFDPLNNQLFWTLNSDAQIRSIDLNLFKNESFIKGDVEKAITVLLKMKKGEDKLRAISIEPCMSMLYFSNWNYKAPSIGRIYVTGYGKEDLITKDITMPNAITLDYVDKKLFWADARLDKIERCDYDGKNRVILAHSSPKHPFSIAVFGDFIFWTDWILHSVLRANKYSGNDVTVLRRDVHKPMGIVVVQETIQNCTSHLCSVLNGGCEDSCLPLGDGFKCECTQGVLDKDGKRCVPRNQTDKCDAKMEFECTSGECVPMSVTCDLKTDCSDGSDEKLYYCSTRKCPAETFFQCRNFRCVPIKEHCDGFQNCGDGSDEEDCTCKGGDDEYHCGSGECIQKRFRCDFDPDCKDASDEMGCGKRDCMHLTNSTDSSKYSDAMNLIQCEHTTSCYLKRWECDGENDCWDNSDEKNCDEIKTNATCPDNKFQCANGVCISLEWLCDNEDDCHDGDIASVANSTFASSDEQNCQKHCHDNQFRCENSTQCIPLSWTCDGIADCPDKSDEFSCENKACEKWEFQCNKTKKCIEMKWKCDGHADCDDKSDEADCLVVCHDNEFTCHDHKECIHTTFYCDGDIDCGDGSDEHEDCDTAAYQANVKKACKDTQFTCANKDCVNNDVICDLKKDCTDGSDENVTLCENSPHFCGKNPEKYECKSGSCINATLVCNGLDDCGDFSDEERCNIDECEFTKCDHKCHDLKIGYECQCHLGFKVNKLNSERCDDIDECEERPCSQLCLNTYGSYRCECMEGYTLKGLTSCKVDSPEHGKIMFSNRYYIRSLTLDGHADILVHNLTNAVALDYDWSRKYIYYSDVNSVKSEIVRIKWDGNATRTAEVLHSQNLKNPDGLAFDWIGKNLYWCDKGRKTIEVSQDDGKYRKVLIDDKLEEPRAIVLDPYRKYMYWTDWGNLPHIGRAGMDGSDQRYIVNDRHLGWPNALTISFETNELFYGDAREDFIAVCDLNGDNRKIIASRANNPAMNLHHIFSIAVWEDRVYWSDWELKSIEYCDKYTGLNCGTLITTVHRPMDLRVFHPIRQRKLRTSTTAEMLEQIWKRKGDSKSKDTSFKKKVDSMNLKDNTCVNHSCSGLCLLSPLAPYFKCACPDNFILDTDQKTCLANCTAAQILCKKTMKCIPFFWKCDGQSDCDYREDEPDSCPKFYCQPGQFQCDVTDKLNVTCLDPPFICDGTKQCRDGKDEDSCDNFSCFLQSQFRCDKTDNSSAYCIDGMKRCNGQADCPNGNDEKECPLQTCSPTNFECESTGACIPKVWTCDGDTDCTDGSDEKNCTERLCPEYEFRCDTGRCIPFSWKCDGENDCPNGEDEGKKGQCDATTTGSSCDPSYFKCVNSAKCIPGRWKCDYENDCDDGSDEVGCPPRDCSESEFRCGDGRCIRGALRCNQEYNCNDFSDEVNCNVTCDDSSFKCENQNICVNKKFLCDGDFDCTDGSDEKNCGCSKNEFKCSGAIEKCILNEWLCDGIKDCPIDGNDEHDSRCLSRNCTGNAVKCQNGRCVPKYLLCDGQDNCGDGSDEKKCPSKKQDLSAGKTNCKFGSCSQVCLEKAKVVGSFQCKCADGYHKIGTAKNATCRAVRGQHMIFTASESELRFAFGLLSSNQDEFEEKKSKTPTKAKRAAKGHFQPVQSYIKTASSKITSFDYVLNEDNDIILFWLDSLPTNNLHRIRMEVKNGFDDIKNSGFDGSDAKLLTENKMKDTMLKALAVDWVGSRIYLIENDMIKTVDYDGKQKKTVIDAGLNAWDLVLDPQSRKIFWSTMLRVIVVASMDGSEKKRLVTDNIEFASGLTIDYPARRLYWCDIRKATVETTTLDGHDRQIVKRFEGVDSINHLPVSPLKVDIFEDDLFVIMSNQTVHKINKFGHDINHEELNSGPHRFRASHIKIIHAYKRNHTLPNPCGKSPCDSSAICLLSSTDPLGRTCNCPDDLFIQKNGTEVSCVEKSKIPSMCVKRCHNNGKCVFVKEEQVCECLPKFEGKHCEHYICSEYCLNHGVCELPHTLFSQKDLTTEKFKALRRCKCPKQWTGDRCEIPITVCNNECHNGGTCNYTTLKNGTISETCVCPLNFSGLRCENCASLQCMNGGTCHETGDSDRYQCMCNSGFVGRHCEIVQCESYCKNNGECTINSLKRPMCKCKNNYSGEKCETDDLCAQMCKYGEACTRNAAQTVTCEGSIFCADLIKCDNNGYCKMNEDGKPYCVCSGQWRGEHCQTPPDCVVDECGRCEETSSVNECLCKNGLVQPCLIESIISSLDGVSSTEIINTAHETVSIIMVLVFLLVLMTTMIVITTFYFRRWQRRNRFFAHARLNENVEEITNPIFDYSATEDIVMPVTNISGTTFDDDKAHFSNPLYESMYASASHTTGLLDKKRMDSSMDDEEEEIKNDLL